MPAKPRVITIEEHYQDPDVARAYAPEDQRQLPAIAERLNDLTGLRIKEMDEAGIDMQVLSHANPGLQKMDAETAVRAGAHRQRSAGRDGARASRPVRRLRRHPHARSARPRPMNWNAR